MARRRRVVVGFAAAGALVAALLWAVGPERVAARLSRTDPAVFSVGFPAVLAAYWCWSEALAQLLAGADPPVSGPRYRAAYLSAEFVKKVLPMGSAAAPLFLAFVVSRETDIPYERTLAGTTLLSLVNIATSLLLATAGLAWLLARGAPLDGAVFVGLLGVLALSLVVVTTLVVLVQVRRPLLERVAARLAGGVRETVGRVSGRVRAALAPDRVREAVDDLSAAVDGVLADWRAVAVATLLSVAGWALFFLPVYTSVLAVGAHVPYALVLFVVPVVMMVNVVPLPGGFGGFDVAVAAILATLGGVALPTVAAALFLYRLTNYWFVVLVGGLASLAISVDIEEPPPVFPVEEGETGTERVDDREAV